MLQRLFFDHPRAMGETYGQHLGRAEGFGIQLVAAGVACMVHGLVPAFFRDTGSNALRRLHQRMVVDRMPVALAPSATKRQDASAGS